MNYLLIGYLQIKNFKLQICKNDVNEVFIIKKNSLCSYLGDRIDIEDPDCKKLNKEGFIETWIYPTPWGFESRLVDSALIFTELSDKEFKKNTNNE